MATNPPDLPSQVAETLEVCPRFRILLVGKSGVGKSSLVSSIFNISKEQTDVQHNRAGTADIQHEYTSPSNPRFILHDSQGFEAGSVANWGTACDFVKKKSKEKELKDQLHAIWLCIQTPRTGMRLLETGDQNLLNTASELNVPVIVVFTKYDMLVNEMATELQECEENEEKEYEELEPVAEAQAKDALEKRLREYKGSEPSDLNFSSIRWAKISTSEGYGNPNGRLNMLQELTRVTRDCLRDVEGALWPPWAAAQQVNAQQKVEFSIQEGLKKYWLNLAGNTMYENRYLIQCIARIRDDILLVWNFYDPVKLLTGPEFGSRMYKLIEELLPEPPASLDLSTTSNFVAIAATVVPVFGQIVGATTIVTSGVKSVYSRYHRGRSTGICLGAYIVDITVILHRIFLQTLIAEPPRPITHQLVNDIFDIYQIADAKRIHALVQRAVDSFAVSKLHEKIAELIRDEVNADRKQLAI